MMNRLIELVSLVSRSKIGHIDIIGVHNNYDSLVQKLYRGIESGKYKTDEDAIMNLYKEKPSNNKYQQLQYALEKRLHNTLFHIDISEGKLSDFGKAYYTCHKNLSTVHILLGKSAKQSAISLAERTIKIGLNFELTNIVLDLARILRSLYSYDANSHRKNSKFKFYQKIVDEQLDLLHAEIKVEDMYRQLVSIYTAERAVGQKINLKVFEKYIVQLRADMELKSSNRLNTYAFLIFSMYYELSLDIPNVIKVCEEAIEFFSKSEKRTSHTSIFMYQYKLALNYTTLKQFRKAEQVATDCLKYVIEGSRNWFITHECLLILYLHSKKYNAAYAILLKAQRNKAYRTLLHRDQEIWEVYNAYIHYLIRLGKIDSPPEGMGSLKKFRVRKFINSVPIFSKDKRGVNVSILILQVMFLLEKGKLDELIDRVKSLEHYSTRYLKNNETYRSNCFIKMLMILPKAHFHKAGVTRKSAAYLEKLKSKNNNIKRQTSDVEIVPYEHLWELILESLENEFKYRAKQQHKGKHAKGSNSRGERKRDI